MKILNSVSCLLIASLCHLPAFAEEVAPIAPAAPAVTAPAPALAPAATYSQLLQKKYTLTEAEAKSLSDSKLPDSQQAMAAQLARSSGKTIDEVLKMRSNDKMGWGKIAKTLGVPSRELGKAVSGMNHERNSARKMEMEEKREAAKKSREEARAAKIEEKRKERDNRLHPKDKAKPATEETGKDNK